MGRRREGREAAVQFLFAKELHKEPTKEEQSGFWDLHMAKKGAREFAEDLVRGVQEHQADIDQRIESVLQNYRIERLAGVDRNILRVAIYEMLVAKSAPTPVVINEAIEIAKKFGAEESGRFVNGILDKLAGGSAAPGREMQGD